MTNQYINNYLKYKNNITYSITEKKSCIDGLWECHLIGYTLKGYLIIMRHYYLENELRMSVSDILHKKKKDTKAHEFKIQGITKKHG